MKLIEVNDKRTRQAFHEVPRTLYRHDREWVCVPDPVIEGIFDPASNSFFGHGEATRWILRDARGSLIGRVAAFINKKKAYGFDQPTGGMGFFECIDDRKAAFLLFDACRDWLSARGMEAMDGPINFGENDNFWGLLVEHSSPVCYGMNYHPAYYRPLFEEYGFRMYYEQVTNDLNLRKPFPDRFWKIAEWIRQKEGYTWEHFRFAEAERYIMDLKTVYDEAWAFHENFTPINPDDLRRTVKTSRHLLIEEFIWFVYHEGKPIAFLVMMPDANQLFAKLSGRMGLMDKLRFLYHKNRRIFTRARITIMGVVPQYQKFGIESGIFFELNEVMKRRPEYEIIELSWVGDFNPKMRKLHESVGADFGKRHYTYRKLFKDDADFRRSTIIPVDTKEKSLKETDPH
ncbi:MAG TPA: hypothetical protein P5550_10500 [Bacteroidales bacterium]|nr:hypothetical protein [Bacteroidales bacterium]